MMILILLGLAWTKTYAILANTSKGYVNYRHAANLQLLYNILVNKGVQEDCIVPLFFEDPILNLRNPKPGILDSCDAKHFKLQPVKLTLDLLFNTLILQHNKFKYVSKDDSLLIYLCGHGNTNFLKICNRVFIFKNDLMRALKHSSKRVGKILMIIDTCKAESLIDREKIPDNVYVMTTSKDNELSYSMEIDPILGVSKVDAAPYLLYKLIIEEVSNKIGLDELFEMMNKGQLNSKITYGGNRGFKLTDFLDSE